MILEVILAFIIGVLTQRIYSARSTGITKLGNSWNWSTNKLFKKLHFFYCETCPRRHYCKEYKKPNKKRSNNDS